MSTTAEKLTYLNDTKGLLKDSINSLGGNITSQTTFRQYATELDSIYSSLPKVSGTGSILSLTPTLKGRLESVLKGNTLQQTYTGKNLINISSNYQITGGPVVVELAKPVPAGTYIISITNFITNGTTEGLIHFLDSNNSQMAYAGLDNTTKTKTITVSNSITKLRLYSQNSAGASSGKTSTYVNMMLSVSGGNYEPYVGGTASPNPDYPQEIKSVTGLQKVKVEGKNLIDYDSTQVNLIKSTNRTANVNFNNTPILEPGTYTLSLDDLVISNSNYGLLVRLRLDNTLESTTYTFTDKKISFTLTERKTLNYIYVFLNGGDNDNATATFSKMQLEKGSATEYEPYQTPQEYEINLGKNLFDKDNVNILNANLNNNMINSANAERTVWFKCEPNTTYTFTKLLNSPYTRNAIAETTDIPTINMSIQNFENYVNSPTFTYTTSENAKYLVWWFYNTSSTNYTLQEILDSIQIEEGTEATSYSPYFIPIHLYEGDQIIGTPYNWSVKHVMGEVVLDGSETYSRSSAGGYRRFSTTINNAITSSGRNKVFSNNFYFSSDTNNTGVIFLTSGSIYLYYGVDTTTIADFQTWLSTHNTKVVYELAEPTTTPITNTELIYQLNALYYANSYNGTTNITITSEDLELIMTASALKGEE